MGDFEPRMDKWKSDETVRGLGLQFKDAIFNKGRLERERKAAARQAARQHRRQHSWLGRFFAWIWRAIGITIGAAIILCVPLVLILNIWL